MKKLIFLLPLALITIAFNSCKKDKDDPVIPPVSFQFSRLKVGNYWVYQQFDIDAAGNATPKDVFDSCFIEKDTIINGNTYFKMVKPSNIYITEYLFLRDSLHYLINSYGNVLFSSQDFTTIISSHYYTVGPGDTVCLLTKKMDDQDMPVSTPAGAFVTSNAKETYDMYPGWELGGNPRYKHLRYAENVGPVIETLQFYASSPNYIERRLIRYHLN